MTPHGKEVRAFQRQYYSNDVAIFLIDYDRDGNRLIAAPLKWEPFGSDAIERPPSLVLLPERAQQLIDDLWAAGLRPTQGRQSEGVTAAQARHLEDMRAIVADKLKVALP